MKLIKLQRNRNYYDKGTRYIRNDEPATCRKERKSLKDELEMERKTR